MCYSMYRVFNAITTSYVTVVVTVNDVIDEPPIIELSPELKLSEELPVGSIVAGLFTVKDNDKNDTLIYSLSGKICLIKSNILYLHM